MEEVEAGLIHSAENAYTLYPDQRRDEWQTKYLPILKKLPLPILEESGLSKRAIGDMLANRSRPHRKNQELLIGIVRNLGVI